MPTWPKAARAEAIVRAPRAPYCFGSRAAGLAIEVSSPFARVHLGADSNQAVLLKPDYSYAYNNRGIAHERKKERDLAIADYRKALAVNPNTTFALNGLKRLGVAQ